MEGVIAGVILCIFSFFAGVSITYWADPKKELCEAELPRNVECVWSKPEGYE